MATNNATNTSNPITVAQGGTGVASTTAYAVLCGGTTSTGALQPIASVGTSGHVLTSNGAGALPTFQAASGSGVLVKSVFASVSTSTTGTTTIPQDDTIPQNTEGTEFITASITPSNVNNRLVITCSINLAMSAGPTWIIAALFQDSTANALQVTETGPPGANSPVTLRLFHEMTAGTTSSTTFKVRAGGNSACTVTLNGASGARLFGGAFVTWMQIDELTP